MNAAPAITSAASTSFIEGTAGSFTITATGRPTPALSETGALPSGVTFVDNGDGTATLSGTPADGHLGRLRTQPSRPPTASAPTRPRRSSSTWRPRIPPVTTVGGVPSGWVKHSVRITFRAQAGPGGPPVDYTEYRVGSGGWQRGVSVTIARQGATKVAYRSVNTVGDAEATQVCTVRIDSVKPVVTDYGHPVSWQGGTARFGFRVADAGTRTVSAKLVITRYGHSARTFDLGRQATGKRLVAMVRCGLPVGTWNWRIDVRDPAGTRGVGRRHALEVYPR